MTIELTAEQEETVLDMVREGRFDSPQAVVEFALTHIILNTLPKNQLNELIQQGRDAILHGRTVSIEELEKVVGL